MSLKASQATSVLVLTESKWARGSTLPEAMKQLKQLKAKGTVNLYLVPGDDAPSVDSNGSIRYGGEGKEEAKLITVGPVGTVSSVIRKLKELGYSL